MNTIAGMGPEKVIWSVVLAAIYGAVGLVMIYKLGVASGTGTPAENWSNQIGDEFNNNVGIVGLYLVIGLIGSAVVYLKYFKK